MNVAAEQRGVYDRGVEEDEAPAGAELPFRVTTAEEAARRSLLPWLVVPYVGSVAVILAVAVLDLAPEQRNRDLLWAMFLSVTNMASIAVGYYFGGRRGS